MIEFKLLLINEKGVQTKSPEMIANFQLYWLKDPFVDLKIKDF